MSDEILTRFSESAERALLSAAMRGCSATPELLATTPTEAFYLARHQEVWAACRAVYGSGANPDLVQVIDYLKRERRLEAVGGEAYLMELSDEFMSPAGLDGYSRIVIDHYVARSAIASSRILEEKARDGASATELVLQVTKTASRLTEAAGAKSSATGNIASALGKILTNQHLERLKTGFNFLDDNLSIRRQNLVYIAGFPGTGKSTLATNIAARVAITGRVLYSPLEMNAEELTEMIASFRTGIKKDRIVNRTLSEQEMALVREKVLPISENLKIIPCPTVAELGAQARAMKYNGGIDLIVQDTMQLMDGPGGSETEIISRASRGIKRLATELDCPIIGLCQFTREAAKAGKRPHIHDLKGSSSLEQDANAIIIMHQEMDSGVNEITLYGDKSRGGATWRATCEFNKSIARFSD